MRDEYHGQGGSYELAPDGTRRLVSRTQSAEEAAAQEQATESAHAAADEQPARRAKQKE